MSYRFPALWDDRDHGPNPLSQAVAARRAAGATILDLTHSNPTTAALPLPRDWTAALSGSSGHTESLLRYEPDPRGLPAAREAVAAYLTTRGARGAGDVDPGDVFLTAGTSEAYSHLFRVLGEPGDGLLVPAPSYPLLETLAALAGWRLATYPTRPRARDGFTAWPLDREALVASIDARTRIVCVVQPDNPTGAVLTPDDEAWLLDLAARRGLAIVVDEVFADYRHDGGRPRLLATGPGGPPVFTLNGLSKLVGLPQLKLAWIHVAGDPADTARAREALEWIGDAYLSVSLPPQILCAELLPRRAEFQEPIRARLTDNLATLRALAATCPRLRPLWPQGGWCVPLRCDGIGDDERFAVRLTEREGVLVQPGYFFGFADDETLVVGLLTPPDTFREGVARLARALDVPT